MDGQIDSFEDYYVPKHCGSRYIFIFTTFIYTNHKSIDSQDKPKQYMQAIYILQEVSSINGILQL